MEMVEGTREFNTNTWTDNLRRCLMSSIDRDNQSFEEKTRWQE